jgi:hypothetical protein
VVSHGGYVAFQMATVAISRNLFVAIAEPNRAADPSVQHRPDFADLAEYKVFPNMISSLAHQRSARRRAQRIVRGTAVVLPAAGKLVHSTAAERMRRHRVRRRYGMRCVTAVLRKGQIERLVHRGWLARDNREDAAAVQEALAQYLADVLGNA